MVMYALINFFYIKSSILEYLSIQIISNIIIAILHTEGVVVVMIIW